jgi:diguanylate cyclase
MRRLAWRLYLGMGALLTGAYYLLPYNPAGAVLNLVVGASAAVAIVVGLRWHVPLRWRPWWLIAAAQGLFVAGDACSRSTT